MTAQGRTQITDGIPSLDGSAEIVLEQPAESLAADDFAVGRFNGVRLASDAGPVIASGKWLRGHDGNERRLVLMFSG